jgi:Arc/MetJ-type ribon-helix-helix transcriptional regulator
MGRKIIQELQSRTSSLFDPTWPANTTCIARGTALYYTSMSATTSRTRTITVRLPVPLADEIETEARKRGVSKSDVVRERLERAREAKELPPELADIADVIGAADGLPGNLSARKKEYLRLWGYGRKRHR